MRWQDILLALLFALLADLLGDWVTRLSRWLVKAAARRVPRKYRARWEEEWLADLERRPRLIRPFFALCLFRASRSLRREYWAGLHPVQSYRVRPGAITAKRLFDVTCASLMTLALAPVMLMIALAVKLTSAGPVLFHQRRYGLRGEEIIVYKFRTMSVCEDGRAATWNDSRVTPLGRILRRNSLDELPALFNVIRGTMSFVGPRPLAVAHNEQYRKLISGYKIGHNVLPGITGLAQLNGFRGQTETADEIRERVEHDIDYVRKRSLWLDIKILFKTVRVFCRDNMGQSGKSRKK
jgi:lipopolysaccharide/colanic/teichoic acid biosynthesis glycosyltransferase